MFFKNSKKQIITYDYRNISYDFGITSPDCRIITCDLIIEKLKNTFFIKKKRVYGGMIVCYLYIQLALRTGTVLLSALI